MTKHRAGSETILNQGDPMPEVFSSDKSGLNLEEIFTMDNDPNYWLPPVIHVMHSRDSELERSDHLLVGSNDMDITSEGSMSEEPIPAPPLNVVPPDRAGFNTSQRDERDIAFPQPIQSDGVCSQAMGTEEPTVR